MQISILRLEVCPLGASRPRLALGAASGVTGGQLGEGTRRELDVQRRAEVQLPLVHLEAAVVQVHVGTERAVADAEKGHRAGPVGEEVRKVLPPHRRLHLDERLGPHQRLRRPPHGRVPRLGVDGRREGAGARRARRRHRGGEAVLLDGGERGVDTAAAERRRAPQHRLDLLVQETVPFLGERADGAAELDAAWDDVIGRTAMHERRRHHTGLHRREIARDDCLKTLQRCRHAHERVHGCMRHRRVPSVPDELGVVEACRRHDRARARRDHARRQARPDMQREEAADSRRVLEDAGEAHGEPSGAALLGGLKEELDGAMQLAGGEPLLQQPCGAEQHRRVGVVTARVHLTVGAAAERTLDLFVDGERVHVCAQAHARLLA
mmetsp:Transcript_10283/g.32755  ORF Transcript_10283/g.32755 Transcript_10283/m.32755 type:complete len:380 (-) Transcript_10283:298-1437(-)